MRLNDNLIFDIGVNKGEDSEFYLRKGFRVVGVEANPMLVRAVEESLKDFITSGQYTLCNAGVWKNRSKLPFYVNIQNDHWSSFEQSYGCRNGTPFEVVQVSCVTIADLVYRYGIPYYMKIDAEGADSMILNDLKSFSVFPRFISVEEYGVAAFRDLDAIGYDRFKIVPQIAKCSIVPPLSPREGKYIERHFSERDSGLFGRELSGAWMTLSEAVHVFVSTIRREDHIFIGPYGEWYDIHATCGRF